MKILITGINGFVGSNFTKSWKNSHTLYGLDINQSPKEGVEKIYSWEQLDEIPQVDTIIHLAGKAHDTKNTADAASYFKVNTDLTKAIFDYFLSSDTKKFIYFSSVKAAADVVIGDFLTEDVTPKPISAYGESKIKAEEYILEKLSAISSQHSKKKVFILRPAMIHGPGNKGNLNLLYKVVEKGIPWPLGAYENRRSFCSIDNITYVVEQLIIRDNINIGIYQVCDDEPLSTNELIQLISLSQGKKAHIWRLSKGLMNNIASIGSVIHFPLNKERLQKFTENYVVSNAKIKKALSIDKMPITATVGLKKTLESFKEKN